MSVNSFSQSGRPCAVAVCRSNSVLLEKIKARRVQGCGCPITNRLDEGSG